MTVRMGEDVASRKFDAFIIVADDNDYIGKVLTIKYRSYDGDESSLNVELVKDSNGNGTGFRGPV